jgi:hypothetical protein
MVAGRFIMIKLDLKFVMLAMRMVFLGALLVFLKDFDFNNEIKN